MRYLFMRGGGLGSIEQTLEGSFSAVSKLNLADTDLPNLRTPGSQAITAPVTAAADAASNQRRVIFCEDPSPMSDPRANVNVATAMAPMHFSN